MLRIKRGEKGRFVKQEKSQKTFWDMQHNWDGLH
jgi:hypothetical protein